LWCDFKAKALTVKTDRQDGSPRHTLSDQPEPVPRCAN
jgi:hypothetical protein